ncbi:PAS domain-containing hybrid sensor histidine kinase/response regulator [Vibrio ostreicida]|uniref:PAS domain-containing hybrid sensor histidine kinase/response regulator n=1 Tax=Vibrio ostreicida TaxID=526588 RepID=UPI001FE2B3F7|nr:ATP-binding protein [Vibrio ostreicida]
MLKFDKKNGMHLFSLFIVVGAFVFMLSSYIFVQQQAHKTAQVIIGESIKGKTLAIERYVLEFLKLHEQTLQRVVEHPAVVGASLEGITSRPAFQDQLFKLKASSHLSLINLYDFSGSNIYQEMALFPDIERYISTGITDESLMEKVSFSFFAHEDRSYLLLTAPISYNGYFEGLGLYIMPLENSDFFESLGSDRYYWFGITQSHLNWIMTPPSDWGVEQHPIRGTSFVLLAAVSPELVANAESELTGSLLVGMVIATTLTLIVMFVFGRRVLVSPFRSLAESEHKLLIQSKALVKKEAESARLARVVKHMRDAVVFTDLDSKITWINGAFEQLTGYRQTEMVGKNPGHLLQGVDTDRETAHAIRKAIDARQPGFFELLNYHRNGEAYWIEIALTPLYSSDDKLEGFMAVERDISQRIALEGSLKVKAVEAESANMAKSQFLAAMSHELRTPMNGILGVGDLLLNTPLNKEQYEYVDTLLGSGAHMLNVLNDILDFSKIEAGKLNLEPNQFMLKDTVLRLTRLYKPLCTDKNLEFDCTYSQPCDRALWADETRLLQILQNLLSNALKFTSKGGISLTFKVHEKSEGGELIIVVEDSGIGIGQDNQLAIFDPFSQAENNTTRRFGGTGLGLSITRDIVEAMKGRINLTSELGKGSCFTVTIPIEFSRIESQETQDQKPLPFNGSGLRMLIVEDTKVNSLVLGKFLKNKGFEFDVVENGQLAIEKVQQQHYDG